MGGFTDFLGSLATLVGGAFTGVVGFIIVGFFVAILFFPVTGMFGWRRDKSKTGVSAPRTQHKINEGM